MKNQTSGVGRFLLSTFLHLLPVVSAFAQSADTAILGTVTEASGAVIPGAKITIQQPATGLAYAGASIGSVFASARQVAAQGSFLG